MNIRYYKKSLLILPLLCGLTACGGSSELKPLRDDPLQRTMDVANDAVFYDRLTQAEKEYKQAFDYALKSDDVDNINDAGYNLAIVQLELGNLQKSLNTVHQTRNELTVRNKTNSPQLDLVEAAILYRMKRFSEAAEMAKQAEVSDHHDVQERSYFLSAIIANDQNNINQLQLYSQKLDQLIQKVNNKEEETWNADQDELHGLIAFQQGQYAQAIADAKSAENIRRSQVDYRGMVRALIIQAQSNLRTNQQIDAAKLYLRAGQSAALLKEYKDAKDYLNQVISLHADSVTYNLALKQLSDVQKKIIAANKPVK